MSSSVDGLTLADTAKLKQFPRRTTGCVWTDLTVQLWHSQ